MGQSRFLPDAEAIWRAALAAVEPGRLVRESVARDGDTLRIRGESIDLAAFERTFLVAFGKAAPDMAGALASLLGDRLTSGLVVAPAFQVPLPDRLERLEAAHPVPDERSVAAAERALAIARGAGERDLLIAALSGGGSSLVALPAEGVSLDDKRRVTDALLRAGASIEELNAVRKHLSAIKGGRLCQAAFPAETVTLAISDVIGDDPATIASGPTHADPSTFADARAVLERYRLWGMAPEAVKRRLERGSAGELEETLKDGDASFRRSRTFVIGSNMTALRAAKSEADRRGFETVFLSSSDRGEARKAASNYAAFLAEMACAAIALPRPLCLLAGGELTVTVKGRGRGGRNTEFVLAALSEMERIGAEGLDWLVLSLGTDGLDGPTDAAGAWADRSTAERARELGLDPAAFLDDNDSYTFFERTGGLIKTGPTGTNVMDLRMFLIGGPASG